MDARLDHHTPFDADARRHVEIMFQRGSRRRVLPRRRKRKFFRRAENMKMCVARISRGNKTGSSRVGVRRHTVAHQRLLPEPTISPVSLPCLSIVRLPWNGSSQRLARGRQAHLLEDSAGERAIGVRQERRKRVMVGGGDLEVLAL